MEIRAKNEETRRILVAAADGDIGALETATLGDDAKLRSARCNSGCTALHWAAGTNHVEMVRHLVMDRQMDVNIEASKKSRGRTPLHYSCRNGCLQTTVWLLQNGGADPDPRAKHGVTPFQLAVWQNQLPICKYLVEEHQVDPCQLNDFDCGAVHWLGLCPLSKANVKPQASTSANVPPSAKDASNEDRAVSKECSASIGEGDGGLAPSADAISNDDGGDLLPLARWLDSFEGIDFAARQRQGHTPLHKAAWGGHIALIRYLRDQHNLFDEHQDDAGNFAADLADMANTPRHDAVANYLRDACSLDRLRSCEIMGVQVTATHAEIRTAYLEKARQLHPDRQPQDQVGSRSHGNADDATQQVEDTGHDGGGSPNETSSNQDVDFDALKRAYHHLVEEGGRGKQRNPAHSIHLMLTLSGQNASSRGGNIATTKPTKTEGETTTSTDIHAHASTDATLSNTAEEESCFKARLIAVLLEYGEKGLDLSNVTKKWRQLWPDVPFPNYTRVIPKKSRKVGSLSDFLLRSAGDVIELKHSGNGTVRVFPKGISQTMVSDAAAQLHNQAQQAQQ